LFNVFFFFFFCFQEKPHDWDTLLPSVVYVWRDLPNSWGMSLLELPYGHLALLTELWTGRQGVAVRAAYLQVFNLRQYLPATFNAMRTFAIRAYRDFYSDRRRNKPPNLVEGSKKRFGRTDKVMVLMPTQDNKLLMHWAGESKW
jgi:hypothetical protein